MFLGERTAHGARGETLLWEIRHAAMSSEISQAHGPHYAIRPPSVKVRTRPYWHCPLHRLCVKCFASIWECAMHLVRVMHMEHGGTPYFSPVCPLFARVLYRGLRHAVRLFKLPRSYRFPPRREAVRLKCSVPLGIAKYFLRCRCTAVQRFPP